MGELSPAERFWERVAVGAPGECWPWLGPQHARGYGRSAWNGGRVLSHRLAFALANGMEIEDLPDFTVLQLDAATASA